MIDRKEVVRMRVPFPDVDSGLAVQAHMYVCIKKSGTQKEFIKCQSFKPTHLLKNRPPYNYVIESPDINRNPFINKTTIDCDKCFHIDNVIMDKSLLTKNRNDICKELYQGIKSKIRHKCFSRETIDVAPLLTLNRKISLITYQ